MDYIYLQIPGLMPRQFDRVKLHMTVLNTIFRKGDSDFQEEKAEQQQRETLDARSLLKVAKSQKVFSSSKKYVKLLS